VAAAAAAFAATICIGAGAGLGAASPAVAGVPASQPFCPPVIAEAGVQYHAQNVYAPGDGPYDARIVEGSFPGVEVTKSDSGSTFEYTGAPTRPGVNVFTVELSSDSRDTSRATCTTRVYSTISLNPAAIAVERIDAADRYSESVGVSKRVVPAPATAPLVYLASGEGFADALSVSAVAAQHSAPLLLSTSTSVPPVVADELKRLSPADVVIVGGEATLKPAVVSQLQTLLPTATITRIAGNDRYEVSRNVISDPTFGAKTIAGFSIASGRVFPDALSATPAAHKTLSPVLLVDGRETAFTSAESALIASRPGVNVTFLGGANTISPTLSSSLEGSGHPTSRISGADRYFVSSAIAHRDFVLAAPMTADTVYIATGANYPDALAGGVLAALGQAPIVLATRDCIPTDAAYRINQLGTTKVVLLGGRQSLGAGVENLTVCTP
jgi:putative cell wall-binding protein